MHAASLQKKKKKRPNESVDLTNQQPLHAQNGLQPPAGSIDPTLEGEPSKKKRKKVLVAIRFSDLRSARRCSNKTVLVWLSSWSRRIIQIVRMEKLVFLVQSVNGSKALGLLNTNALISYATSHCPLQKRTSRIDLA